MPAVSMAAIRASLKRDLDADFGDIVFFSKVMEPRHEFLTANNQTPYVLTVFDLRNGPWVRRRHQAPAADLSAGGRHESAGNELRERVGEGLQHDPCNGCLVLR